MNKRRILASVRCLVLLLFFCMACLLATWFAEQEREKQQPAIALKNDQYRNQGLELDAKLEETPEATESDRLIFKDRVLLRCQWTEEGLKEHVQALRSFLNWLPQRLPEVTAYVSVMPLRIGFEETFSSDEAYLKLVQEERQKLEGLETAILSGTEDAAVPVPVMDTLLDHQDEYIFFRTEAKWTAQGAYYAAQAFLEAAGLEPFPMDSFQEYVESYFFGGLADESDFGDECNDWLYYYLYKGYNPLSEMTVEQNATKRPPVISKIRLGARLFLGGGFAYCSWDGLSENGRRLLVIDQGGGNVAAPWMVTQFEKIAYVGARYYNPSIYSLEELVKEWKITDLWIVVDASRIGDSFVTTPLNRIVEGW